MKQVFIKIKKGEDFYNKDLLATSYEERSKWYESQSKGQIMSLVELLVQNELIIEEK